MNAARHGLQFRAKHGIRGGTGFNSRQAGAAHTFEVGGCARVRHGHQLRAKHGIRGGTDLELAAVAIFRAHAICKQRANPEVRARACGNAWLRRGTGMGSSSWTAIGGCARVRHGPLIRGLHATKTVRSGCRIREAFFSELERPRCIPSKKNRDDRRREKDQRSNWPPHWILEPRIRL